MKLQTQLRLITAVTVIMLAAVIIFAKLNLTHLRQEFDHFQKTQDIHTGLVSIKATALSVARVDPILPETEQKMAETDSRVARLFSHVAPLVSSKENASALKQVRELWQGYAKGIKGAIAIAADSPVDALNIPDAMYKMKLVPMVNQLDALVARYAKVETATRAQIDRQMRQILSVVLLPLIAAAILVTLFQTRFGRHLARRLNAVTSTVETLRQGDLSKRLPVDREDEIGTMSAVVNGFVEHLQQIVGDVRSAATDMDHTTQRISAMADTASDNAQHQTERFAEVSSAITQLGHSIDEIAATAAEAAAAAGSSSQSVARGTEIGREAVTALERIDETVTLSSATITELEEAINRIGQVSHMISDIAEQTNLLALNAAIEAARAGEQGRGFAVVAGEVRELSKRTASSTGDIFAIVKDVQDSTKRAREAMNLARDEVEAGVSHGRQMGRLLSEIDMAVQRLDEMMAQVASTTTEQSTVAAQIADNVHTVASITTATAEEIESTRHAMSGMRDTSRSLKSAVDRFSHT